jgi:hypothetical protein
MASSPDLWSPVKMNNQKANPKLAIVFDADQARTSPNVTPHLQSAPNCIQRRVTATASRIVNVVFT